MGKVYQPKLAENISDSPMRPSVFQSNFLNIFANMKTNYDFQLFFRAVRAFTFSKTEKFFNEHVCSVETCGKSGKPTFPLNRTVDIHLLAGLSSIYFHFFQLASHLRLSFIRPVNQLNDLQFYQKLNTLLF